MNRARDDHDAFVAIITGAGDKAFCAGWDLSEAAALTDISDFDRFRVAHYNSDTYCGCTRKADIFKPIIAAVNGGAFAAGLETALLADIRSGAENAEFGALERARSICELPQGAIRWDKESVMRGIGRTLEERLRIEAEMVLSMSLRKDKHTLGAQSFLDKKLKPEWPHHGL